MGSLSKRLLETANKCTDEARPDVIYRDPHSADEFGLYEGEKMLYHLQKWTALILCVGGHCYRIVPGTKR